MTNITSIEFFTKYGVAAEMARFRSSPVAIIVSGAFASSDTYDILIPDPNRKEGEEDGTVSAMALMLSQTGSLIVAFPNNNEAYNWFNEMKANYDSIVDPSSTNQLPLSIHLFDEQGILSDEFYLHQYTPQEITHE